MKQKKQFTHEEMARYADLYFIKNFRSYTETAKYFETSSAHICNVIKGRQPPSKEMLISMGYVKTTKYERVL